MAITVLVVDDSKLARIVMAKAITALQPDWTRVEAGNADEALAAVGKQRIDVVILDFNMPGKDGLALAEELRARFPAMPIAVATANVQDEVVARARAIFERLRQSTGEDPPAPAQQCKAASTARNAAC